MCYLYILRFFGAQPIQHNTHTLLHDHFTDCSLIQLWDLSAADTTFLTDVSLLDDAAAEYPSCDDRSVGSAVLRDTTLNTATVAYYTGITPGFRACFVCDRSSEYELNPAINERICQLDATWSGISTICGMNSQI